MRRLLLRFSSLPPGKLAECWDANTGFRASCPNLQPKNDGPKVRHDFQFLAYCVEYTSFFKQKMHDRFRLLAMKLPLQKRSEAKEILLVPTLSPKSDHRAESSDKPETMELISRPGRTVLNSRCKPVIHLFS